MKIQMLTYTCTCCLPGKLKYTWSLEVLQNTYCSVTVQGINTVLTPSAVLGTVRGHNLLGYRNAIVAAVAAAAWQLYLSCAAAASSCKLENAALGERAARALDHLARGVVARIYARLEALFLHQAAQEPAHERVASPVRVDQLFLR